MNGQDRARTHLGKAEEFAVQWQFIGELEVGIVEEVTKDILIFKAVDSPRNRLAILGIAFVPRPKDASPQIIGHRFPVGFA